ncbi:MAG: glutathione peroxidase [Planctomycetaceae bacterium]|nr:glutathione peroxidase [Planctomycetaceae bacterium]
MKWNTLLLASVVAATVSSAQADEKAPAALNFTMKSITGQDVNLADYKGKVVLVVNVASKCGNTKQYAPLEELHEKLAGKGLAVLGFPCNQFGGQEPGTEAEIAQFCAETYKVKFPLFSKIEVNGANAAPFYKHLTTIDTKPKGAGDIKWNFEKFVIGRNGDVVARFAPATSPDSQEVMAVLEAELAK